MSSIPSDNTVAETGIPSGACCDGNGIEDPEEAKPLTGSAIPSIKELIDQNALFVVNHSGGKDSQAMYLHLISFIPAEQIVVVHAHLPEVEWDGVIEHIENTIYHELHVVQANKTFLEMVERRKMWPSPSTRQCTSDLKRGPIEKQVRTLLKNRPGKIIVNCMGLRAEESANRKKKPVWRLNTRNSKAGRTWYEWLPIHTYSTAAVFKTIADSGQKPHWAYAKGMSRLSCCFCIMASEEDLKTSARLNPKLHAKMVELEERIDHTLRMPVKGERQWLRDLVPDNSTPAAATAPTADAVPEPNDSKSTMPELKPIRVTPTAKANLLLPAHQQSAIRSANRSEGELNSTISRLNRLADHVPKLRSQSNHLATAVVVLHYFVGNTDFFITEWNGKDEFFGYTVLNGDYEMAEHGSISRTEILSISPAAGRGSIRAGVELNLYERPRMLWEMLKKKGDPQWKGESGNTLKITDSERWKESEALIQKIQLALDPNAAPAPDRSLLTKVYANPYELNKAIELLINERQAGKTAPAEYTADEKAFLSRYTGNGGLEKFGAEGIGLLYEYYTPDPIVQKMWALALKYGYKGGTVLEPAVGIGAFLKYLPKGQKAVAYETNSVSALIAQVLFPHVEVRNTTFESEFIRNNESIKGKISGLDRYSLVIGNPPYGEYTGRYAGMGEKGYTKAHNWIDYFTFRGLDLLRPGGLLVYVIGAEVAAGGKLFLQQGINACKAAIADKADLVDAYRLPNGVFDRTDVLTDIIVLRKK